MSLMRKLTLECNDIKCKHHWWDIIDMRRINGNRLIGCTYCPKCGRYDAPYIIKVED